MPPSAFAALTRVAFSKSTLSRTVLPRRMLSEPSGWGAARGLAPGIMAEGGMGQPAESQGISIGRAAIRVRYLPNAACAGFGGGGAAGFGAGAAAGFVAAAAAGLPAEAAGFVGLALLMIVSPSN
jgi:hypothetical protein